jgi:hypothetical protein
MHAVTGVGQVQKAAIDATLVNDIGKTLEGDKAAGGTNGEKAKGLFKRRYVPTVALLQTDRGGHHREAAAVDVTCHGDSTRHISLLGQKSAAAEGM